VIHDAQVLRFKTENKVSRWISNNQWH